MGEYRQSAGAGDALKYQRVGCPKDRRKGVGRHLEIDRRARVHPKAEPWKGLIAAVEIRPDPVPRSIAAPSPEAPPRLANHCKDITSRRRRQKDREWRPRQPCGWRRRYDLGTLGPVAAKPVKASLEALTRW